MTIRDIVYLSTAAAGILAIGFKFRYLRRQGRTPQLWAIIVSLSIAAAIFWSSSPQNIQMLNRATGIANFTAPLVYSLGTTFAGSTLMLAIFWRYPPALAWPRIATVTAVYGAAVIAIPVLFSASHVPVERVTDFETYYATQPTVAALLMIYIVTSGIGQGLLAFGCLVWARSDSLADRPWLRRGLRLYGIAALLGLLVFVEKLLAVISNWFGLHWLDTANTVFPLIYALPAMLLGLGAVVLPIWGPRLPLLRQWSRRWVAFWRLQPLHRALRRVDPAVVLVARRKRFDPHHRVRRQLTELSDFEWRLQHQFDPAVGERAQHLAQEASLPDEDLHATVKAAQLKAALAQRSPKTIPEPEHPGRDYAAELRDSTDIDGELARWLRVAKAFVHSPIVGAVVAPLSQQRHSLKVSGPKS